MSSHQQIKFPIHSRTTRKPMPLNNATISSNFKQRLNVPRSNGQIIHFFLTHFKACHLLVHNKSPYLGCKPKEDKPQMISGIQSTQYQMCVNQLGLINVTLTSCETLFRNHHWKVLIHIIFKKTGPHIRAYVHTRTLCLHPQFQTFALLVCINPKEVKK